MFLVAFALVFGVVRPAVAAPFKIPSVSMVPTLEVGDHLIVNKFVYDLREPKRGEIVVFDVPWQSDPLTKRVVGLPGDRIQLRQGKLFVNGKPQNEPYIANEPCVFSKPKTCSFGPVTVPSGDFFAMGDNRAHSIDSRYIGPVPDKNIEGEAILRFWPPDRVGIP